MKKHWNWIIIIERRNYRIDLKYNLSLIRNMKIYVNGHLVKLTKINKGEVGVDYFFPINNHECRIYSREREVENNLQYSVALGEVDLITGESVNYVKMTPQEEKSEVKMSKKEMLVRAISFIVSALPIVMVLNPIIEGLLSIFNWEPNDAIRSAIDGGTTMGLYIIIADYIVKKLKAKGLLEGDKKLG